MLLCKLGSCFDTEIFFNSLLFVTFVLLDVTADISFVVDGTDTDGGVDVGM